MNVTRPIEPAVSNGYRFILVATNYFIKWVEAASYREVTKKVAVDFAHDRIIRHKNSTAYRPQMNGAVEAANNNITKILRKMIEKHKQWHDKLLFALLGYRTIVRTSTGATLYMLVYSTEAVIPVEVEISSLRIIQKAELDDTKWVKSHNKQLALIDGMRMNAWSTLSKQNVQILQQKSQAKTVHTGTVGVKENFSASR
ncbi:uncharacterized protein [Nicotiana sylvestris]|uniref:uncharacterized protein n=1 Tax=Nicotiana sylvestris TaxID=4096 RepID=UPI00388C6B87